MTLENHEKANKLLGYIDKTKSKIDVLKKDIHAIDTFEYTGFSMRTPEFEYGRYPSKKHYVNFFLDKKVVSRILKDELYTQENLLKKYTLEFDNL